MNQIVNEGLVKVSDEQTPKNVSRLLLQPVEQKVPFHNYWQHALPNADALGITIENDRPPIFFVGDYPFKLVMNQFAQVHFTELKRRDLWPEFMQIFRVLGNQAPELVVVFMPHKNAPQYKQVKRIGDVERGFATQVNLFQQYNTSNSILQTGVVLGDR